MAGKQWDAVVDVSWQPDQVRSALRALAPNAGHWVYVSSGSVYAEDETPDTDETAPLHDPHEGEGPVDIEVYGPAKVACELACREAMGDEHTLLARAGLIAGYGDRSDRFGYWPARIARADDGEQVLIPPRDTAMQVIDVADLAAWLVDAAQNHTAGAFNAVGDESTVGAVLDACLETTGRSPELVEASHDWLSAQGVEPWAGPESLPLWLPRSRLRRLHDAPQQRGTRHRAHPETGRGDGRGGAAVGGAPRPRTREARRPHARPGARAAESPHRLSDSSLCR